MEAEGSAIAPVQETPLTERILRRLGPPRWVWVTLWASAALLSPIVRATVIRFTGQRFDAGDFLDLFVSQLGLAFASFVLLWGVDVLARQALDAREELGRLTPGDTPHAMFGRIGVVSGPIVLTVAVVAIASASGWAQYGPLPQVASMPFLFVYMLPILTFVWVYVTILVDLHHLGSHPLKLDAFPQDRTLGLEKLGSLASTGLGLLLFAAVPALLAGASAPVTLAIGLSIVAAAVAVFLLSMWRLHRQMAEAKARHVAFARRLYAEAYAPIRGTATAETLASQSSALSTAQSLDERAHALPTWPIDEGTLKFLAVVVTGVVTSIIVRGLFAAIGF